MLKVRISKLANKKQKLRKIVPIQISKKYVPILISKMKKHFTICEVLTRQKPYKMASPRRFERPVYCLGGAKSIKH